jgi:hypothetical protein
VPYKAATVGPLRAAAYEARMRFGRIMLQPMQASGESWHSARSGQALVLVRSYEADPGIAAATKRRTGGRACARRGAVAAADDAHPLRRRQRAQRSREVAVGGHRGPRGGDDRPRGGTLEHTGAV